MDNFNSSSNKIPYDHTPIFRSEKNRTLSRKEVLKIRLLTIISIVLVVVNICLSITCYTYLKNGKIKVVNVYNDTFTTGQVSDVLLKETMRATKYSAVCVSVGLRDGYSTGLLDTLTNEQFYNATKSHGSGFLYKIDLANNCAYFVTCFHVIDYSNNEDLAKQTRIWLLPPSKLVPFEVEMIGYSEVNDIAILKYNHENILESLEGMVPVSVYDSTFINEFETVFTIGNPLNYGLTGTSGEISSYRHLLRYEGHNYAWIKTDVPINPGNSGGGFFNSEGKLIGMVNANIPKTTSGDPVSNMAYAIPGTMVVSIADNVIANNLSAADKIKKVNFGITITRDEIMGVEQFKDKYKDRNGNFRYIEQEYVKITAFDSSSVAKGKLQIDDRLVSMEIQIYGETNPIVVPIVNTFTINEYAYAIVPGSEVKFNIERQNRSNNTTEEYTISLKATIFS